jgi:hypothetical protein
MDTLWYAVDRQGHVAAFWTSENGHLPEGAASDEELSEPSLTATRDDRRRLFSYEYGEDYGPLLPYDRSHVPALPLHVDELPPAVRNRIKQLRFDTLDFADSERLQPLEFFPCVFSYDPGAYLCADGETVRPVPGREDEFVAFCQELRINDPELARRLHFEGPEPPGGGRKKGGR